MSEMIEQIACAIALRRAEIMLSADPATRTADERELVRAALKAMREPTLEMLDAGHRAAKQTRVSGISGMTIEAQTKAQCARENAAWRAMIDAALTE